MKPPANFSPVTLGRRLGYAAIVIWLASVAISLNMMWDKRWMESDPLPERITGVAHGAAVAIGIGLGLSLLAPTVRRTLTAIQIASYAVGCVLALASLSRFL